MRREKRPSARQAREARPPRTTARSTDPARLVAHLGTQIRGEVPAVPDLRAVAEFVPLVKDPTPPAIDKETRARYARKIEQQFGEAIDGPELTRVAGRYRSLLIEDLWTLSCIAPGYADLLEKQRGERRRFLKRHAPGIRESYAHGAAARQARHAALRAALPSGMVVEDLDFDTLHDAFEIAGQRVLDFLWTRPQVFQQPGPVTEVGLNQAAHAVSKWTKARARTAKADWKATVMIMECHGWDLGRLSLEVKARQLESRYRKYASRKRTVAMK